MTNQAEAIRAAYDQWAANYDANQNPTRELSRQVLRQHGFRLAGKLVLEIGCGTGLNTVWLAEKAAFVAAIDFSAAMLQKARQRTALANVEFHLGDIAKEWIFAAGRFDFVCANLVLEHLPDLQHIFRQAYRVLKPGGRFYLSELHPYKQLHGSQARFRRAVDGAEVRVPAFVHAISEFVSAGLDAGFAVEHLGEWHGDGDQLPRLLTLLFKRC